MSVRVALFASGRGSNFDAIMEAVAEGRLNAQVVALVCDRPDAPVLEKARKQGVPALLVPPLEPVPGISREELRRRHDLEILRRLQPYQPRFLVFAGYMRLISEVLLEAYRDVRGYTRIVNIHPSLLPAFPGVSSYRQAFAHGAKLAGVTVHLVENEMDSGPICAQEAFPIADCRTAEEVERRGMAIEHRLYPQALDWILKEKFDIEVREGRLCVCPN